MKTYACGDVYTGNYVHDKYVVVVLVIDIVEVHLLDKKNCTFHLFFIDAVQYFNCK